MDFEQIIADLAREQAAEAQRELNEEVASLAEAELVSAQISDRLRAVEGGNVKLSSAHGYSVTGTVIRTNPAWVILKSPEGEELISIPAVALAQGLQRIAPSPSFMETRMGLTHILRRIMRERTRVCLVVGVHTLVGAIGAVYSDHLDLVGLESGEPRVSISLKSLFSVRIMRTF